MRLYLHFFLLHAVIALTADPWTRPVLQARADKPGPSRPSQSAAKRQRETPRLTSPTQSHDRTAKRQHQSLTPESSARSKSPLASKQSTSSKSTSQKSQSPSPSRRSGSRSPPLYWADSGLSRSRSPSSSPDLRKPPERHASSVSPDLGPRGGISLSRSNSASSVDVASAKTRADGPVRIQGHGGPNQSVPANSRHTLKTWNEDGSYSRASVSPSGIDDQNPPKVGSILKGTRVITRLDTRRGGSGYINTDGRRGFRHQPVGPGQVVEVKEKAEGRHRAIAKGKLNGPGILESESYMGDRGSSLSSGYSG